MGKIVIILISTILITLVAAIGALPVLLWGASLPNYLATFCILIALQLFLGKLWNYLVDRSIRLRMEKVVAANAMAEAVQLLQVVCAYCGTSNLAKIYIGEDNLFDCEACGQENAVQISTSTARVTKPIMPKADAAEIFKELDKKAEDEV